jgi:hypothetical protein
MKETKFKYKYGKYNKPTNKKVVDTEESLDEIFDEDIDDFFSFS